jgi:hypothetical protein
MEAFAPKVRGVRSGVAVGTGVLRAVGWPLGSEDAGAGYYTANRGLGTDSHIPPCPAI